MNETNANDNNAMNVLPRTVEAALQAGVPADQSVFVSENFARVVRNVTASIDYKFKLGAARAEELALAAALYTLAGYVNGTSAWPADWKQWAGMARWKAKGLALDLVQRRKNSCVDSYDAVEADDEGGLRSSPLLDGGSYLAWREEEAEKERQARIEAVRYAIPKVVNGMRGRNVLRNLKIVRAVYQEGLPTAEVAERFGIRENHLFQILFVFRDAFRETGPQYMAEYLAA